MFPLFERQRLAATNPMTGRGLSRGALAETLISEALTAREGGTKEGAA